MMKIVNLCLMLSLAFLPLACGDANLEIPDVSVNDPLPAQPEPDPVPEPENNDFPEVQEVPHDFPEICAVTDENCGNHHSQIGKVSDHPPLVHAEPGISSQINPCLQDPEGEGCDED